MNISLKKSKLEAGATLVEYALMILFVVLVVMAAVNILGQNTNALFQNAVNTYPTSTG